MKTLVYSAFAVCLLLVSGQTAGAMDKMHGSMMMPACAAGDPVVGVNMMNHMYLTHDQMKMKMAGMSESKQMAMMKQNHVKMMCMSKAKAMGAKMMSSKM